MTTKSVKRRSNAIPKSKAKQIEDFFDMNVKEPTSKSPTPKRSRSSTSSSSAVQLLKKMAKNKKDLSSNDFERNDKGLEDIPKTLGDLEAITDDQRIQVQEIVLEMDELLDSEAAKRIQSENEVTIRFCCPFSSNVGTAGQTFCVNDFSLFNSLLSNSPVQISPFDLLFFCRPQSRLRCTLLERFRQSAVDAGGTIAAPYSDLVFALCYTFQVSPFSLQFSDGRIDGQMNLLEQKLEKIADILTTSLVHDAKRKHCFRYSNVELLLQVWFYFRFDHWTDQQLVTLCRGISRLYLDIGAREFRSQLIRALQMTFNHLSISSVRLYSVLSQFLITFCSTDSVHNAFVVCQMFSQLKHQFEHSLPLMTMQSVLKAIISNHNNREETTKLTLPSSSVDASLNLGDALDSLPEAVFAVRHSSNEDNYSTTSSSSALTVQYLLCNRWVDTLTADERQLFVHCETEASLEKALQHIRQANEQLNRRNINDKMIHTWAQSEHRIRAALLSRQRGQLRLDHAGSASRISNKPCTFVGSSSEDDDDDKMSK